MRNEIRQLFQILGSHRFMLTNEKEVQADMERLLHEHNLGFRREHHLDSENIIDFMMDSGVGIEVKTKGQKRAIYKQCLRYSTFDDIQDLILVTSSSTGMPPQLNGKNIYILNLSKAWL